MSAYDAALVAATTFHPSARARAMRVAPKKRQAGSTFESKCVAVVLRPGMRQQEFRRVQRRLERNRLAPLPVIVGAPARQAALKEPICGLIAVGSDMATRAADFGLERVIREAIERKACVLAMSDAAAPALAVAGQITPVEPHAAVLIQGPRISLLDAAGIDSAIDQMGAVIR